MHKNTTPVALAAVALAAVLWLAGGAALAADDAVELTIRNHRFEPEEVKVPAGQRVKLVVFNADATPEEFESLELNREKVIPGGTRATIYIGPLSAGTYTFVGEFHEDTARGRIVVQ